MKRLPTALLLGLLLAGPLAGADEAETQFNFATGLLIKNEHALAADEFETDRKSVV